MKYQVYVRRIEKDDLSFKCPYPDYDEDTYNMHLDSLVADIRLSSNVIDATESNSIITIESSVEEKFLLDNLKPLFQKEFCFVKCKKIKSVA